MGGEEKGRDPDMRTEVRFCIARSEMTGAPWKTSFWNQ